MTPTILLEYRLTLKDYQEAFQAHSKSQRFWYFFNWVLSILFILLGSFYIFTTPKELGFIGSLIGGVLGYL